MIYVDPLLQCKPSAKWPYSQSCHLTGDEPDELHAFAKRLGLRQEWYQDSHPNTKLHHYDLTASKRALAVRLGAKELSRQEVAERVFGKVQN
jgi:hypothetical protein